MLTHGIPSAQLKKSGSIFKHKHIQIYGSDFLSSIMPASEWVLHALTEVFWGVKGPFPTLGG